MREKILSLAKGNFIYETPKLCLSIEKLVFEVTAGTHGTASFLLENSFGTRVKVWHCRGDVHCFPAFF